MGCKFSKEQTIPSNYIRVVHVDGHVEDFDRPLTSGEVTGKLRKQFLCTQAQLISGGLKPLKPDTRLEPSHVYFLLSYSTLQSESSALDIAIMAKKLIKLAKTKKPQAKSPSSNSSLACGTSPGSESPGSIVVELSKGSKLWKPVLDTISERSFNLRSESDLKNCT